MEKDNKEAAAAVAAHAAHPAEISKKIETSSSKILKRNFRLYKRLENK